MSETHNRILIIDDDQETLEALQKYFEKKGYEVVAANNGLDGLKHLETRSGMFDLLITDIVMPNISGVGVVSIAKKKFPDLPVIAITGWGEHPEALASEAHADAVLRKPFQLSVLEKKIKALVMLKSP